MATTFPGGSNTFVPSTEASNNMVVDFSRNPRKFALSQYCQYVPVKKNIGLYYKMTVEMAGRVLNDDLSDLAWPDGAEAPSQIGNLEEFGIEQFHTKRYAPGFRIGELAADQADWDVLAQHARIHAQRMMTARTVKAQTVLQNTANYPTGHTSLVTDIPDVTTYWDLATTNNMVIKRSLDYAADQIQKATLGAVEPDEMIFVIGPDIARRITVSQEFRDHIKQSPQALQTLKGEIGPKNNFGMPEELYGYKCVVEKTVRVTNRKGSAKATSYVLPGTRAMMLSRPGGLEGVEGAPSFSTATIFLKEEMTVESKHDRDNRRHVGRVVDDFDSIITAGIAGYLFQSPLSS